MPPIEYEDLKYDMNSLSFLLKPQTSKQLQTALRETLAELFNVYEKFQTTVSAINNRTEFHVAKAQPLLERANVHLYPDAPNEIEVGGQKLPIWEKTSDILRCLENVLGHRIYQILLQSTEQIINSIDDTKESLLEMRSKLIGSMNQLFPENAGDILHFEPK
jgi:ribosomal protein L29